MTTANTFQTTGPAIVVSRFDSEWVPTAKWAVSHTEFGHYMSFVEMTDAMTYAFAVAEMMDLTVRIVCN